jgi:hypothetical protein
MIETIELGDLRKSPSSCTYTLLRDENKDFSYAEAGKDFGFSPLSFEEGIKAELRHFS